MPRARAATGDTRAQVSPERDQWESRLQRKVTTKKWCSTCRSLPQGFQVSMRFRWIFVANNEEKWCAKLDISILSWGCSHNSKLQQPTKMPHYFLFSTIPRITLTTSLWWTVYSTLMSRGRNVRTSWTPSETGTEISSGCLLASDWMGETIWPSYVVRSFLSQMNSPSKEKLSTQRYTLRSYGLWINHCEFLVFKEFFRAYSY